MYQQPPPQGPYGYQQPQQPAYYQQPMIVVQQNTAVIKAPFNHTVHIVLDVCTCGGWLPVHLLCWALH